jgi:putative FmdB family regulatory protein
MPIYAFVCTACGHQFDRLQKLSDPDPGACPACSAEAVKRQLTAPSFRLAGSGWYETDFKKDGDRKRNLSEKGGEAKTEAKSDAKSDAKPAATSSDAAPAAKSEAKPARTQAPAAAKPAAGTH